MRPGILELLSGSLKNLILNICWASLFVSNVAAADGCPRSYGRLALKGLKITMLVALHPAKIFAAHVVAPVDIATRTIYTAVTDSKAAAGKKFLKETLKNVPHALIFGLLNVLGRNAVITSVDYDAETASFDDDSSGICVFVTGMAETESFTRFGFDRDRARRRNCHIVDGRTPEKLMDGLAEIRQKYGPISRLEYLTHGNPGSTSQLSPSRMADWAKQTRETGKFNVYGKEFDPKGMFAPNAKIRFTSCSSGDGEGGQKMSEHIATVFLIPNGGGTVMTSGKVIVSGLEVSSPSVGISTPDWFRRLESPTTYASVGFEGLFKKRKDAGTGPTRIEQFSPKFDAFRKDLSEIAGIPNPGNYRVRGYRETDAAKNRLKEFQTRRNAEIDTRIDQLMRDDLSPAEIIELERLRATAKIILGDKVRDFKFFN